MSWPRIPGLSVAIIKGDRIVYLKGFGQADPSGRPVTPQTPFIIGSITKSFTALAVMQLVEAGKVDLDAPVQKYIPWFRTADANASAQITVRQLLYQTSGLPMMREPQFWTDTDAGALERTVRFFAHAQLDFSPGLGFGYSNANYETAGLIVQMVSGQSYEEYVKQHILAPLDMKNSFPSEQEASEHGMAIGHRWWFGFPVAHTFLYNRSELPAGYLYASAEDMAHFMIAEMNGGHYGNSSVLSHDGIASTQTGPTPNAYAMGWERPEIGGRHLINHDGGTANFQCSVFMDPDEHVGVFVAANIMSALDAFSTPHGAEPLDGETVRGVALSVLSLATKRPLPDQGRGKRQSYVIFDLVLLTLTTLLVISLMRIRRRYQRLRQRGIWSWWSFGWRSGLVALLHFTLPVLVVYLAMNVLLWHVLKMFQPDLIYWLEAVALVLLVKGVIEIALLARLFRQSHALFH
jgi:CubicO group peptidase (beta-lactamase class C family)